MMVLLCCVESWEVANSRSHLCPQLTPPANAGGACGSYAQIVRGYNLIIFLVLLCLILEFDFKLAPSGAISLLLGPLTPHCVGGAS